MCPATARAREVLERERREETLLPEYPQVEYEVLSGAPPDRRKHVRFAIPDLDADLDVLIAEPAGPQVAGCRLRDLSFSGMGFTSVRELGVLEVYTFRIRIGMLQEEPFSAEAEIYWKRAVPTSGYRYGAVFRESSKGWLGSHP